MTVLPRFAFCCLAALSLVASAADEACIAALRRSLDRRAAWTMTRRIGPDGPRLVSSGTVDCVALSGIVWRVASPFASSVSMTTNALVLADEEGERTKSLADMPHYAEIRERTDAFVAGDRHAFDGLFDLSLSESGASAWRLALKPRVAGLDLLFTEVVLTGAALPTNAVLKTADGGRCDIRFTPLPPR